MSQSTNASELRLRAAVESSPSGLLMTDSVGRIVLVNREIERLFGYPREELLGQPVELLIPDRSRQRHEQDRIEFYGAPSVRAMGAGRDLHGRRKDGSEVPVEIGLTPVVTGEGMFVLASVVDISTRQTAEQERRRLEAELRQSQKLEAVGTLAGGIAHDFNNILGAIMGYAELLKPMIPAGSAEPDLQELLAYCLRGRDLVQQILTFSRRRPYERQPLQLERPVAEGVKMLRATLPASIEIQTDLAEATPAVMADPTSIHQVLMNLATNAAQSMTGGGQLSIGVSTFFVRDSVARANPELREGAYVRMTVADTGHGIDAGIQDRVFEPFFSTKPPGKGTGLGLSIVHGIMRDHDGVVRLESRPQEGTRVECLFPVAEGVDPAPAPGAPPLTCGAGERILLIDDEPGLARLGERRLREMSYEVVAHTDPASALATFQQDPMSFDLVMTDYTMPQMNGLEVARTIHQARRDIPIVLATGFIEDIAPEVLAESGIVTVVRKPSTITELSEQIAAALRKP